MVHVLCFGNLWQGDDGFGIHVCRRLESQVREGVMRVFDVGLRSLDALHLFEGCGHVILVDALHEPGTSVGTVRILALDEIHNDESKVSHAVGVAYLLQALAATRLLLPKITLIGAVAAAVTPFSNTLSAALEPAINAVSREVMRLVADAGEEGLP